jgi:hypothetical protein
MREKPLLNGQVGGGVSTDGPVMGTDGWSRNGRCRSHCGKAEESGDTKLCEPVVWSCSRLTFILSGTVRAGGRGYVCTMLRVSEDGANDRMVSKCIRPFLLAPTTLAHKIIQGPTSSISSFSFVSDVDPSRHPSLAETTLHRLLALEVARYRRRETCLGLSQDR